MEALKEIDLELRRLLKPGHPARPFVCSGTPIGCEVAIVGANPSSSTSFWDAWSTEVGFEKEKWLLSFDRDPANDKKVSRHRIDQLVAALAPTRCIELNAYPYCYRKYKDLPKHLHDGRVLEYLLATVKPKAIYASGWVASREVAKLTGADQTRKGAFTGGAIGGHPVRVLLDEQHFMEWQDDEVDTNCKNIALRIRSQL